MTRLQLNRGNSLDPSARCARARLLADTLGIADTGAAPVTNPWLPIGFFAEDGRCVANIDAAILPLTFGGKNIPVGGLRSVAVAADWRGRGLFRDLMREALAWCEAKAAAVLLYTEEPELYTRFDFQPSKQLAFEGAAPHPSEPADPRIIDVDKTSDQALVHRLVETRALVSARCALTVDAPLVLANLAKDEAGTVAYAPALDALIVFDEEPEGFLVIEDVIAAAMPAADRILGALGKAPKRLKTLFPPDRLGWHGTAVDEDTGLMIRGHLPAGLDQILSIPPTAEF